MRWTLVWLSAIAGVLCFFLGQPIAGSILFLGVGAHTVHWLLHRKKMSSN